MKLIMFSSDPKLLESDSGVKRRMIDYGNRYKEVHIVLLNRFSLVRSFGAHAISTNVWIYPTNSYTKITAPLGAFFTGLAVVSKMVFTKREVMITAQDPFEIGLSAFFLAKFFSIPFEAQIHTDIFSSYFAKESLKNRVRVVIARFLLPRVDRVRVVSGKIKEQIVSISKIPEERVEVRPVAIDPQRLEVLSSGRSDFLTQKYPQFKKTVLMVSRLTNEKNYLFALQVFADAVRGRRDIGLIIVGDGPERANIILKAKELGLSDQVYIEGWQEEIGHYYRSASVLFHASKYEGYGVVFKEAEYCKLPIVSSDVGIASEVALSKVFPVNDVEAARDLLSAALTN